MVDNNLSDGAPSGKQWRWLADYPDYMVSSDGDVRHRRVNAPFMIGDTDPKGYRRVLIAGRHLRVSRIVCEAFHGACPKGRECAHLDGNIQNNSADNLAWVTPSENNQHKALHGTSQSGERNPRAKLTAEQVDELRTRAAAGVSERALAAEFGISPSQAHRIKAKERWNA